MNQPKVARANEPGFNPAEFLLVPARRFEDLKVGDIFRAPSRILTDAHPPAFQTVSADNHPLDYDAVWAARRGHTAPVGHELQVLAFTAPRARMFPHYIGDVFIAFTELSCKFLREVHSGDTLYSALAIPSFENRDRTGLSPLKSQSSTNARNLCCWGNTRTCLKLAEQIY